ncbi:MAG TPA: glycosyltransferase [Anaerolineales bacterium]|nr:glycosyltransferase [Anaerolineales bacterium]
MDGLKVSVIIPFYNSEKFMGETIESVFAQTYQDWELLLVDDGSTDTSRELAISYANQHPDRVRYLSHAGRQNRGASPSRNLGLKNSRGDIILFLDSDDILLPEKLETHVQIFERHPEVDALFGATLFWYGWTQNSADQAREFVWEPWKAQGIQADTIIQPPELLKPLIKSNLMPCPSSLMLRRNMLDRIGGWPEDLRNIYDDHGLCVKLFMQATLFIAPGCQEKYRIHEDSWIHNTEKGGNTLPARIFYLNWVREYLSSQNYHDTQIEQYLDNELVYYQNPFDKNRIDLPLPVGLKNFGDLHRITPVSRRRGLDRSRSVRGVPGQPIDSYYIEAFLERHGADIKGQVLEAGDSRYTRKFGGSQVSNAVVLGAGRGDKPGTGRLHWMAGGEELPHAAFDCLILPNSLSLIYDVESGIKNAYAALKPGGVLLATLPGIRQISHIDRNKAKEFWRFTDLSVEELFGKVFGRGNVEIETYGNVLAASALLFGLESHELQKDELDFNDPDYEVVISVRAIKKADKNLLPNLLYKLSSSPGKLTRKLKLRR